MMEKQTLLSLKKGETGIVCDIIADDKMLRRFLDMGCTVGTEISMLGEAPLGGLCAYLICGALIALRKKDAAGIHVLREIDHSRRKAAPS